MAPTARARGVEHGRAKAGHAIAHLAVVDRVPERAHLFEFVDQRRGRGHARASAAAACHRRTDAWTSAAGSVLSMALPVAVYGAGSRMPMRKVTPSGRSPFWQAR
jgi:malate/lactate dehydrogenase